MMLVGTMVVAADLSLVSRSKPSRPVIAFKSFLRSIANGRYGYAWTCLCPTAREQTVASPDLRPVETKPGTFTLRGVADVKAYASSFARTSGWVIRTMWATPPILRSLEGDVASVEVGLHFQSWPWWIAIVAVLGFIILRPLAIIGVVLYFAMRKRRIERVRRPCSAPKTGSGMCTMVISLKMRSCHRFRSAEGDKDRRRVVGADIRRRVRAVPWGRSGCGHARIYIMYC